MAMDEIQEAQLKAAKSFSEATEGLKFENERQAKLSFMEEAGLSKEKIIHQMEDKLLKFTIARAAYNVFMDRQKRKREKKRQKEEDKTMAKALGMDTERFKRLKSQIAQDKARKSFEEQRKASLTELVGEERAEIAEAGILLREKSEQTKQEEIARINREATEKGRFSEDVEGAKEKSAHTAEQIKIAEAEAQKRDLDLQQRIENSHDEADLKDKKEKNTAEEKRLQEAQALIVEKERENAESDGIFYVDALGSVTTSLELIAEEISNSSGGGGGEGSGGGDGVSPAERDAAATEQTDYRVKHIGLLEQIAASIGGDGGSVGGEGSGDGEGGGGMLAKLGAGLAALGKGIGILLKYAGTGLVIFLKAFAIALKGFAKPAVIGGIAIITAGIIGLGFALKLAAPAFEALAPVLMKIADVIGNVLMTAIKEIPAIFESIGSVIKSVGGVIIGIIEAIGGAVAGVVTSIAEGIATVVNAVKGDAKAEAEAQIAVLEAQTLSIQKLSKIDPGTMAATASGIESIKESLDGLGSPGLLGSLGKMLGGGGPISELLELAKNSQGITDASTAINKFVENAKLFEKGVDIDDSVIEGIQKVVKALGSGNPAGLSAFDKAINSINGLDASKISLLQGIKIPQITPQTAAEYEKVFNAMQKNQPDLIDKVSSTLGRFFGGSRESGQRSNQATIVSSTPPTMQAQPAVNINAPQTSSTVTNQSNSNTTPVPNMPTSHSAAQLRASLSF